ncbi:MAG: cyclic nucleotide-binding domain-containing protein [Gammaproteobacteria bacterium]|nr:cyclic nucleotide-binding domain-containing protein [Gammaproteobacteria bacterium]
MSEPDTKVVIDAIREFALYQGLSNEQLTQLAPIHMLKEIPGGQQFICQGEESRNIYFILKGEAKITILSESSGKTVEIGIVPEGFSVGHYILAKKRPRNATVTAKSTMTALVADVDALLEILNNDIQIGFQCYKNHNQILLEDIDRSDRFIEHLHNYFRDIQMPKSPHLEHKH